MADDLEWYELVALREDGISRTLGDGETKVAIYGDVQGVTIVRLNVTGYNPAQVQQALQAAQAMLEKVGIRKALFMPAGVEFVAMRKVSPEKVAELEKGLGKKPEPGEVRH